MEGEHLIIAIIAAVGAIAAAAVSSFGLRQSRQTHTLVNGRLEDMLKMTASAAHAAGVAQEKAEHAAEVLAQTAALVERTTERRRTKR